MDFGHNFAPQPHIDYLLVSLGATTATGLAHLVPEVSPDQVPRLLAQSELSAKDLWRIVKPQLRAVQSPEAVVIIDDSVAEKPYTAESELHHLAL